MKRSIAFIGLCLLTGGPAYAQQITGSGSAVILDRKYVTNDKLLCDSMRISMSSVSAPAGGMRYFAWLVEDNDTTFRLLGGLDVSSGNISFAYADPTYNLVARFKKLIITEEVDGFSAGPPTIANLRFEGALYDGEGAPGASNALTYLRNVIGAFSTPNNLGLMTWMFYQLKKNDNLVQHAGFAANAGTVANVKLHTDHSFDFANGALSGLTGAGSIASNGDPLGYSFYRYGDLDTMYTSAGGAGYHISMAMTQSDATLFMTTEGNNALMALKNVLGSDNVSGWAKDLKDKCLQILTTNYGTNVAGAKADASLMRTIAQQIQNGSVGAGDSAASTGGIFVAWWRAQAMASYSINPVIQPPRAPELASPDSGSVFIPVNTTLRWFGVAEADSYQVWVAVDSGFPSPIVDIHVPGDTSLALELLQNGVEYFWQVRGVNSAGPGAWSSTWRFTTIISVPTEISLVDPPDSVEATSDTVIFVWLGASESVTGYWFELGTDSAFAASVVDSLLGTADTSKTITTIVPLQRYWWRVRGKNEAGWGAFSRVRTFVRTPSTGVSFSEFPDRFALGQNYPNPFNPETEIPFQVPISSHVTIVVYDLLGRRIAEVMNGSVRPGRFSAAWNASAVPSGVYVYRMEAIGESGGRFVQSRRVVVIR